MAVSLYHGGYFDAQYQLWAPGPIIRMQKDATTAFSPKLYRKLVQPVDRMIARQFECNFIYLHTTSMFMLDAFLEIDELRGFEINLESFNIPVDGMIQYYRMVQDANRPLLIRKHSSPRALTVVSSDHRLHRAARRRRATPIDSDRWVADV
jgi:hypothetical protein